ncbi:MAG: class I SAM-dependent RNA methyltransferase [Firmicutes bacterium]|nr:class I SAM-dependent RNA methyltransferase [Bacillota bacterium]
MYKITSLNNQGLGICYVNNKITFVYNTLIGDVVDIEIIRTTSKYNIAKVKNYIKRSDSYKASFCKYSSTCGGCNFLNMSYEDTLVYKREKVEHVLKKFANIDEYVAIVSSDNRYNYRNKITLQVQNKEIGYYTYNTNEIVAIDNCLIAKDSINQIIPILKEFNVNNGKIIIRCNYIDELLIHIITDDRVKVPTNLPSNIKGIVVNSKTLYGDNFLIDKIGDKYFKLSYDSFFQVNNYVSSIIFDLIDKHILKDENILDLYCGVGTLGLSTYIKDKKLYGIEIVENAINNAIYNAKHNSVVNYDYKCGKVEDQISRYINENIGVVIVDPPRKGLDKKALNSILAINPKQVIYVSCDPITLARDLNTLKDRYKIEYICALDMFPNTYHVETFVVLKRK